MDLHLAFERNNRRIWTIWVCVEFRIALLLIAESPHDDARVGPVVLHQRAEFIDTTDIKISSLVPDLVLGCRLRPRTKVYATYWH